MAFKKGPLDPQEKRYITEHSKGQTVDEICQHLNRNKNLIMRFMRDNGLEGSPVDAEEIRRRQLLVKLHSRPYWREVKAGLEEDDEELEYFEHLWMELIKQFKEDVLATEELQIKQWIILEILTNRCMKDRRKSIALLKEHETQIEAEKKNPAGPDPNLLALLEQNASVIRNAIPSFTSEYTKLLGQIQQISKDMKATRDQRFKRVEDAKNSWIGLIRALEDDDFREKEGREMELMRLAAQKEKERLAQYHQYADGEVDQCILSSETLKDDNINKSTD